MELQRYVSLMSLFSAPSDPLFGALSDPLFGAPSEPPTHTWGLCVCVCIHRYNKRFVYLIVILQNRRGTGHSVTDPVQRS